MIGGTVRARFGIYPRVVDNCAELLERGVLLVGDSMCLLVWGIER